MPRVKRSVHARKKRRKVLEQARGYWGLKHSSYRRAKEQLDSPVYARLARRCAEEPFVDELVTDWSWDVPLRLFGGVHYLVLAGVEPDALSGAWDDFRAALDAEREFLARFIAVQGVQTNE